MGFSLCQYCYYQLLRKSFFWENVLRFRSFLMSQLKLVSFAAVLRVKLSTCALAADWTFIQRNLFVIILYCVGLLLLIDYVFICCHPQHMIFHVAGTVCNELFSALFLMKVHVTRVWIGVYHYILLKAVSISCTCFLVFADHSHALLDIW